MSSLRRTPFPGTSTMSAATRSSPGLRALLAALALSCASCREPEPRPDLGSAELRSRVDFLKQEVLGEPTTPGNVVARNDVLWEWANALAAAGVNLPVDLPLNVALVKWAGAEGGEPELPPGLDLP